MNYRILGGTDLKVSEIGLGTFLFGGPPKLWPKEIGWDGVEDKVSLNILDTCLDLGINFLDTADVYGNGHSEELIGQAIKKRRSQTVICTKGGNRINSKGEWFKDFSQKWINTACEASLKRLQTDYIDIYLYHTPLNQIQFIFEEFEVLDKLKTAGKIRSYGVSIDPVRDGLKLIECGLGDVIETTYNIIEREAEKKLFPAAQIKKVGIIARVPLCTGFLAGKFTPDVTFEKNDLRSALDQELIQWLIRQTEKIRNLVTDGTRTFAQLALQFCLSNPAVSVVISGAKKIKQLSENAKASELKPLSRKDLAYIKKVVPAVPEISEKIEKQYDMFFEAAKRIYSP
jgi:aryl-alcohol dehydrogenase-like predicted oxidoreductase